MPPRSSASRSKSASQSKSTATRDRKRPLTQGDSAATAPTSAKKSKVSPAVAGVVLTVGEGDVGQLGLGPDVMERSRLGLVSLPDKCTQVVAGGMHTACLTVNGDVYTFGCNDEGALGRDTSEEDSETRPEKLVCPEKFVQISAGDSHTAMLTEDGRVFACGTFRDANGPIGLTEAGKQNTAIRLDCPAKRVVKIASGSDHLLALSEDGVIFSAGCAEQGQLGRVGEWFVSRGGRKGLGYLVKLQPVECRGPRKERRPRFVDIWAGTYVSFAKTTAGDVYAWGLNNYYQLGTGDMENRFTPTLVSSLAADRAWRGLAGGQHHSIALDKDGGVYAMGRGTYGQLGLGDSATEDARQPTRLASISEPCRAVEASSSVSFALTDSGKAYAWGMGTSKQLSSGDEDDRFEPALMGGKQLATRTVLMISAGGQHTVLLAKDAANSTAADGPVQSS